MRIIKQAVTGLLPSRYHTTEVVLASADALGSVGDERLHIQTRDGAQYIVEEDDDGHLTLLERGARTLYTHNGAGNTLVVLPVPLFHNVQFTKPVKEG